MTGDPLRTAAVESVVPGAGLEPTWPCGLGIFLPLRLSPPLAGSWSGARLHHRLAALGARRLLSTPSSIAGGLARCSLGLASRAFAEFDGLHLGNFSPRADVMQVPCVYQFHHPGFERNLTRD